MVVCPVDRLGMNSEANSENPLKRVMENMGCLYEFGGRLLGVRQVKEDNVRSYWISWDAVDRVLTLGSKPPESLPNSFIF